MEKAIAPYSSTLAWKIPWLAEPDRLQSMGLLRVGHDWVTSLLLFTFMHWRRKWQPTPVFLPGESQGRGSLVGFVYGVTQSRTRLKRLSSSRYLPPLVLRKAGHPTPVLLPGKSHGRRSLVGCSPWGRWGSDMTEQLNWTELKHSMVTVRSNPLNLFLKGFLRG